MLSFRSTQMDLFSIFSHFLFIHHPLTFRCVPWKMQSCHHSHHLSDYRLTHLAKDLTRSFSTLCGLHVSITLSLAVSCLCLPLPLPCSSSPLRLMSTTCLRGTSQARPPSVSSMLCSERERRHAERDGAFTFQHTSACDCCCWINICCDGQIADWTESPGEREGFQWRQPTKKLHVKLHESLCR